MSLVGETFVTVKALVDQNQVKRDVQRGLAGGFQGALGKGGAAALLRGAGFAGLGAAVALEVRKSVSASTDALKIQSNLQNSLAATGQSWQRYSGFIGEAIEAQSRLSAFDDEELSKTLTGLVRRTGDVGEALRLNALAADIARGADVDLAAAAKAVGRASDGQTAALTRLGIQVRKGATGIEALDQASQKYAGAAERYGETAAGSFDKLNKTVDDLREGIGGFLVPILKEAADEANLFLTPVAKILAAGNDAQAAHPRLGDGIKFIATSAISGGFAVRGLIAGIQALRSEAAKPIASPTDSLLSAGRVEDIRGGTRPTPTAAAPTQLGERTRLELEAQAAARRKDLQAQLRIAKELAEIAAKRVAIVKTVGPLLADRKREEQDALDKVAAIEDEIAQNAKDAADERARAAQEAADAAKQAADERKRAAEEARAAAAAELRQDLDDAEQALQNNLQKAQLTKKRLDDDRKALRALIAFYREQSRNTKLERGERLKFQSSLISARGDLADLGKDKAGASGGATVADFFSAAVSNFKAFGSNVAGRGGVLSAQDERAAFAFEALTRLKGGSGLPGVGAGVGAATGASLDTVVQTQRTTADRQIAEQKVTNALLRRLIEGYNPKKPNEKPKTPGGWGFAASAAEGIWIAGA